MLKETFYLDGVDALSAGIHLQNPIKFSEPVPAVKVESIPGRNGDLIFETGSFKNRVGNADCFALLNNHVEFAIRQINKFLLSKRGYRKLETSDDPDHFWMARVENGARIEQRVRTLSPFEITFNCKPQRFVKSGLEEINVTNERILRNLFGFPTLPLISVTGDGAGTLTVGDVNVEIHSLNGTLFLDSDTQNAYNNAGNQNSTINAPIFPVLESGENKITWTGGISSVKIIPRWWEL